MRRNTKKLKKKKTKIRSSKYVCKKCKIYFSSKREFQKHESTHIDKKSYECQICKKLFGDLKQGMRHLRSHIPRPFRCGLCERFFVNETSLKNHTSAVHLIYKPFSCKLCKKPLSSKFYLSLHKKEHNNSLKLGDDEKTKKRTRTRRSKFSKSCKSCKMSFKTNEEYDLHQLSHFENENKNDEDDSDDYRDDGNYLPSDDSVDSVPDRNDSEFKAVRKKTKTKKSTVGKLDTPKKKREKSLNKVQICEVCGKSCPNGFRLKQHMLVHTGEKPYKCEFCGKAFSNVSNLKRHSINHTNKKPYLCAVCGKSYSQVGTLKGHLCGKQNSKKKRKRKPRQHNILRDENDTDKPFTCRICQKKFSFYGNASRHFEIHMGIRKHHCDICDKRFTQKVSLKAHLLTHQNKEKNYICDVCQKAFQQSSYLRRHYRKEHPEFAPPADNRPQSINRPPRINHGRPRHTNNRTPNMDNRPQLMSNRLQPINHEPVVHNQFSVENERCFPVQTPIAMPYINQPVDVHHGMPWPMLNLQDQF